MYVPIFVFEGGQCYTRHFVLYIMNPIQIIANIYGALAFFTIDFGS